MVDTEVAVEAAAGMEVTTVVIVGAEVAVMADTAGAVVVVDMEVAAEAVGEEIVAREAHPYLSETFHGPRPRTN